MRDRTTGLATSSIYHLQCNLYDAVTDNASRSFSDFSTSLVQQFQNNRVNLSRFSMNLIELGIVLKYNIRYIGK